MLGARLIFICARWVFSQLAMVKVYVIDPDQLMGVYYLLAQSSPGQKHVALSKSTVRTNKIFRIPYSLPAPEHMLRAADHR